MKSELLVSPRNELFQRWRRQFVVHRRRHSLQTRPLAALSCFTRRPIADRLVPVDELVLVVLYDVMEEGRPPAIHLAGFAGGRVPWGVVWGGLDYNKFSKDLCLPPAAGACGQQLDLERPWLLQFGLQLDSFLSRCCEKSHRGVAKTSAAAAEAVGWLCSGGCRNVDPGGPGNRRRFSSHGDPCRGAAGSQPPRPSWLGAVSHGVGESLLGKCQGGVR